MDKRLDCRKEEMQPKKTQQIESLVELLSSNPSTSVVLILEFLGNPRKERIRIKSLPFVASISAPL